MGEHIENRNGIWWVPNPAHEEENFADKWNEYPERREAFIAWRRDITGMLDDLVRLQGKGCRRWPRAWRRASAPTPVTRSVQRYGDRMRRQTADRRTAHGQHRAAHHHRGRAARPPTHLPWPAHRPARLTSPGSWSPSRAVATRRRPARSTAASSNCLMPIQPSPASQTYTVRLHYRHGRRPQVTVVDPPLALHPGARAYRTSTRATSCASTTPASGSHDMLLAATILPWTAEWLIHYELWLITGYWTGGGHTLQPGPPSATCRTAMPHQWARAAHSAGSGHSRPTLSLSPPRRKLRLSTLDPTQRVWG